MNLMAMRVTEMGASEGCPVIGQIDGCVASWGQHHLAGNGADFLLVLNSRTLEEPMPHGIQRATLWPIGILLRLQIGLENRFEHHHCRRLCYAIFDRGHS